MSVAASTANVEAAVAMSKEGLRSLLNEGVLEDLAFIGNSSAVYKWTPSRMVDLDAFLFAPALGPSLGGKLAAFRNANACRLQDLGVAFELRIIEGPYKPAMPTLATPIVVAHLGVFTEASYLESSRLKRWAWRKYACEREEAKLRRLSGERPTIEAFNREPKGLRERLAAIRAGSVTMVEWTLPTLAIRRFTVEVDNVAFQECCFAYAANSARNHARAVGYLEPDQLENDRFFSWYNTTVFPSAELLRLAAMKAHCRDAGFDQNTRHVQYLTLRYLEALSAHLDG